MALIQADDWLLVATLLGARMTAIILHPGLCVNGNRHKPGHLRSSSTDATGQLVPYLAAGIGSWAHVFALDTNTDSETDERCEREAEASVVVDS